ncbi:MAG: hypothetical protein M1838_003017 [Thelocarpon superellum]|nr:MAG: hypothetical protein M1838_003017 [Thelocarpon superellum]
MAASWSEMFPPNPSFTEADIPDQFNRVFIVTGGASGCGFETAKALFHLNGSVYIAGRSPPEGYGAIEAIKASAPAAHQSVLGGRGELHFIRVDMGDLSTVKTAANFFLGKERRLDVIWHNDGVMIPPEGAQTAQGFDLQFGANVLGPFLFQHFLTPLCLQTAALPGVRPHATRVVFVSSSAHRLSPKPDGVQWDNLNLTQQKGFRGNVRKYAQSKAFNVMHAHEFARRFGPSGLVSVSLHPGDLKTDLPRNTPAWCHAIFGWLRYEQHYGGLTELYAGLNQDVDTTMLEDGGKNGAYILPWGRFGHGASHVFEGLTTRKTGERAWEVCEDLVTEYT